MTKDRTTNLYLVPTPIGNLQDFTFRAVEVLKSVDLILAEDTRTTGKLLNHYGIETRQRSYHIHNEHKVLPGILEEMHKGTVMALVSDAGTPGISDPGFLLVRKVLAEGLYIDALPGATAFVPALLKSGFPTDRFCFEGFLPHKKGRLTRLLELARESRTVVLYESPHRLLKLLDQLAEHLEGSRMISVSRELTKMYEETITGTVTEVRAHFSEGSVKGEIVVVIDGNKK